MTLVEFFENSIAENICTSIAHAPDRVVLLGSQKALLKEHALRYESFFAKKGINIDFSVKSVGRSNVRVIIDTLEQLLKDYPDVIFDITGGNETFIYALGVLSERIGAERPFQVHYINIRTGATYDCDMDGVNLIDSHGLSFSISDNIELYGGRLISSGEGAIVPDPHFSSDLSNLWDICRKDCRAWNRLVGFLLEREKRLSIEQGQDLLLPDEHLPLLVKLKKAGYLSYRTDDRRRLLSVSFKNGNIEKCFSKEGQLLEYLVYDITRNAPDKDGQRYYNDAKTGVVIGWDKNPEAKSDYIPDNEIDVMMMRGMIPCFVSCKNGAVSSDELFLLRGVSIRFGGKYSVPILIAPAIEDDPKSQMLLLRAKDMGIRVIPDADRLSKKQLEEELKKAIEN